jgi:hypothetical protein
MFNVEIIGVLAMLSVLCRKRIFTYYLEVPVPTEY